jgi:uncharacterized membrane protein
MVLILLTAVMFVWSETLSWKMKQPEYVSEVESLKRTQKKVRIAAWIMVGLVAVIFLSGLFR